MTDDNNCLCPLCDEQRFAELSKAIQNKITSLDKAETQIDAQMEMYVALGVAICLAKINGMPNVLFHGVVEQAFSRIIPMSDKQLH